MNAFERPDTGVEQIQVRLTPHETTAMDHVIADYEKNSPVLKDEFANRPAFLLQKDQTEVDRLNKLFARKINKSPEDFERYGKALEAVMMDFASCWLPGYLSKASEYDDYQNNTDLVLEMQDDNDRILRVAIDVTSNSKKVKEKIFEIFANLRAGHLSKLKYFTSQIDDSNSEKRVPRVVIGSDNLDQLNQLFRLYLKYRESKEEIAKKKVYYDAIANHPIGKEVFAQMLIQLRQEAIVLAKTKMDEDQRDRKVSMIEATVAELERYQNEKAASQSSSDERSRNGVLGAVSKALATA